MHTLDPTLFFGTRTLDSLESKVCQGYVDRRSVSSERISSSEFEKLPEPIKRASAIRIEDFQAGRRAAAKALNELGQSTSVGQSANGIPIWPEGVVGSITHTKEIAWAVVGWEESYSGIGIDCEQIVQSSVAVEINDLVSTPDEQGLLPGFLNPSEATTLLFSAKESIYKCLNPLTGWPLDFHDATFVSSMSKPTESVFSFQIDSIRFGALQQLELDVKYHRFGNHVFTICLLPNLGIADFETCFSNQQTEQIK